MYVNDVTRDVEALQELIGSYYDRGAVRVAIPPLSVCMLVGKSSKPWRSIAAAVVLATVVQKQFLLRRHVAQRDYLPWFVKPVLLSDYLDVVAAVRLLVQKMGESVRERRVWCDPLARRDFHAVVAIAVATASLAFFVHGDYCAGVEGARGELGVANRALALAKSDLANMKREHEKVLKLWACAEERVEKSLSAVHDNAFFSMVV